MITKWWQSLANRERLALLLGTIGVVILAFYFFILSPFNEHLIHLKEEIQDQQSLLEWMQGAEAQILQLRRLGFTTASSPTSHEAILVLVERKLNEAKLNHYLHHIQQPQSNNVILNFQQVPFDELLHWLQDLSRQSKISIQEFHATKTATTGAVDVSITLEQPELHH